MFVLNTNNAKPLPKLLNQDVFYQSAYPKQGFIGYNASPSGASLVGIANLNGNINYSFNHYTIVETVGSTQINGYFKNLVDTFLNIGNFYSNSGDYGSLSELKVGWQAQAGSVTAGTYTFSMTTRFASAERLLAGKSVGANIILAPAFEFKNNAGQTSTVVSFNGVVATYIFKIMRIDGTLVTIGTVTSPTQAYSSLGLNTTVYTQGNVINSTFTPVITNAGDRIVCDITLSGTCVVLTGSGGASGSIYPVSCGLSFGYTGSNRQIASDYQATRPFQISIT